jgi:hypothetical protein
VLGSDKLIGESPRELESYCHRLHGLWVEGATSRGRAVWRKARWMNKAPNCVEVVGDGMQIEEERQAAQGHGV